MIHELFSAEMPGLRLVHDATSLTTLWTCEQKFRRQMVEGVGRGGTSRHLVFGKAFHAGLEALHNARWAGQSAEECLNAAIKAALTQCGWRETDGSWQRWISQDRQKNAHTLLRALVWYADDLARGEGGQLDTMTITEQADPEDRETVHKFPATEVQLEWKLPFRAITGEDYWLVGNLDRVVEWDDERWVNEVKTTGADIGDRYWAGWDPNVQVKTYDLLTANARSGWSIAGTLLEAHQVGVGFARWARMPLRPAPNREQFLDEIRLKLRVVEELTDAAELTEGPPASVFPSNYTACHGYGDGCPLRGVCRRGWEEREEMLRTVPREVWDPQDRH